MEYPQYRKYSNNKHFFKITSASEFEELSFIGTQLVHHIFVAKILPDRNLIQDLLHDSQCAELSSSEEFERLLKQLKNK